MFALPIRPNIAAPPLARFDGETARALERDVGALPRRGHSLGAMAPTAWRGVGVLACLALFCTTGAEAASKVMEMGHEDFDERFVPSYDGPGDFISLAFYAHWDLRSQKFMPEYERMADMLYEENDSNFTLARINTALAHNQKIATHYKVKSFPHLLYFHKQEDKPYAKTDASEMAKVIDSETLNAAKMLRWLRNMTEETFEQEPVGSLHDEI